MKNNKITFILDKIVQIWSLFIFIILLFKYFFASEKQLIISNKLFLLVGAISVISSFILLLKDEKMKK